MKLAAQGGLPLDEQEALRALVTGSRAFVLNQELVVQGSAPRHSTVLLDGWAARVVTLEGGEQQITELHVPGDFVDLHSFMIRRMDHSIVALSDGLLATAPHDDLSRLIDRMPDLGRRLWRSTLVDAAIHRQWIASMGRRDMTGHLAHLICELATRLSAVGLCKGGEFYAPVHQGQLADVLGKSRSSVNMAVQDLRARDLVAWTGAQLRILDVEALARLGQFEPGYLQFASA